MVPDMKRFLGTEGDHGSDQGVVRVTVGAVKCTGGADCVEVLTTGDNEVLLVPMLGP